MGGWFSRGEKKKKKGSVSSHDRAVLDLKVQRDKLIQYQKKIQLVIERETQMAKELAKAGKKKQAILALKKKKMQEQMLSKAEASLENVQTMVDSVEFAEMEARVFEGLKAGNEVLKELNEEMSIEKVENLMEETREAMEYQDQISEILGTRLTEDDDNAVMDELNNLEAELSGVDKMPEAPTHELKAQEPEEAEGEKQVKPKAKKDKGKEKELALA